MPDALQFVVPAAVPEPPRSLVQLTCVTPTASNAVPAIDRVDDVVAYVADAVGALMATDGWVVSGR